MANAIEKLYSNIGFINPNIQDDIENYILTENTGRSGRTIIWYLDENKNRAIYTDTLELLSDGEIETELC